MSKARKKVGNSGAAAHHYSDLRKDTEPQVNVRTRGRHLSMPRTDQKPVRLYIDFPYVEAMLQFRNYLRKDWAIPGHEGELHCFKMDYIEEENVPTGNKYILKYDHHNNEMLRLTTQIVADTLYKGDITKVEGHQDDDDHAE